MLVGFCLGDRRPRRCLGGLESQAHAVLSRIWTQARESPGTQDLKPRPTLVTSRLPQAGAERGKSALFSRTALTVVGSLLSNVAGGGVERPSSTPKATTKALSAGCLPRAGPSYSVYPHLSSLHLQPSVTGRDWAAARGALQPPSSVRPEPALPAQPTRTRVFGLQPTWPASARGPLRRHF